MSDIDPVHGWGACRQNSTTDVWQASLQCQWSWRAQRLCTLQMIHAAQNWASIFEGWWLNPNICESSSCILLWPMQALVEILQKSSMSSSLERWSTKVTKVSHASLNFCILHTFLNTHHLLCSHVSPYSHRAPALPPLSLEQFATNQRLLTRVRNVICQS